MSAEGVEEEEEDAQPSTSAQIPGIKGKPAACLRLQELFKCALVLSEDVGQDSEE